MVGGENLNNAEVKERHKKKRKHAEEKRKKLAGAVFLHHYNRKTFRATISICLRLVVTKSSGNFSRFIISISTIFTWMFGCKRMLKYFVRDLTEANSTLEDDGIMEGIFDSIHDELRAKNKSLEREKMRVIILIGIKSFAWTLWSIFRPPFEEQTMII